MATFNPRPDRFDAYLQALQTRVPFALSRWGDGEWQCLLGHQGANCDGQPYTLALRRDLIAVLRDRPRYDLGLQGFALQRLGDAIAAWLDREGMDVSWVDADSLARRSRDGRLAPFVYALAARDVVLVGPAYLRMLALFPVVAHVEVPARAVHEDVLERLVRETAAAIAAWPEAVVAISAGMSANVVVHRLHASSPAATLLDCGSLWEPYVGRVTRTYHRAVMAARAQAPA